MAATKREIYEDLVMGLKEILDAQGLRAISIKDAILAVTSDKELSPRFLTAVAFLATGNHDLSAAAVNRFLTARPLGVVEGFKLIRVLVDGVNSWTIRNAPKECRVCGGNGYASCADCRTSEASEDDEPEERGDEVESESYADLLNVTQRQSERIDALKEKVDGLERSFGLGEEAALLRSYACQVTLKEIVKLLGWQPNLLGSYLGCLWGKGEELPIGKELRDRIAANLDQIEKERIAQVRAETRAAKEWLGTLPKIRDAIKSMFGRTAK